MNKKYQEFILENLKDRKEALAYLNAALQESLNDPQDSKDIFWIALRNVAEAQGGIALLAEKSGVGRESLYKTLSGSINPKWYTLVSLCSALGFKLKVF